MGLPRVRIECWNSVCWGKKHIAALRRLASDKACRSDLKVLIEELADKADALSELLVAEAERIDALPSNAK